MTQAEIVIPADLHPSDGRFGSGPSKVRGDAIGALAAEAGSFMGTSHRQAPARSVVARVRRGLAELFALPDGYEVVLGNGGSTAFWDSIAFGLIERRSQHAVFGEFTARFAQGVGLAPHLETPEIVFSNYGTHPALEVSERVDVYAQAHNETSTGVMMPVVRVPGEGLMVVDGTSAAGGIDVDPSQFDVYYFAPQKGFGSDGGLWLALCSPRALERIERVAAMDRYVPPFLDPQRAVVNSRKDQTYNTPGLATLWLLADQIDWMLAHGGLAWTTARCASSAGIVYEWAERSEFATPFVADRDERSNVVATIDLDGVDAAAITAILRANGIVDTEPYRKLRRNQLRIGMFPAVEPDDVRALTRCIDYVAGRLA
jgi:phosphoserine aminotransferase